MNDPHSKEQLKADFSKILMEDADWYFHKQGWYAKSLSQTGSVNIVWRLMENFDQTGNIIAHVSENQVHMSRVRILEGLLESGDNNIQHAKAALQGAYTEIIIETLKQRRRYEKAFIHHSTEYLLYGRMDGYGPLLALRDAKLHRRMMESPYGPGVVELVLAEFIRPYVEEQPIHTMPPGPYGKGEYINEPSKLIDLILQFD